MNLIKTTYYCPKHKRLFCFREKYPFYYQERKKTAKRVRVVETRTHTHTHAHALTCCSHAAHLAKTTTLDPRQSINIHSLIKRDMAKRLPILRQPIMRDEYELRRHVIIFYPSAWLTLNMCMEIQKYKGNGRRRMRRKEKKRKTHHL